MTRKLAAEVLGTFWLVFGGCGAAIFAGPGIGLHGIAMAFGLTVLTMAYAVGGVSGGHFNPAVTLGLVAAGRHPAKEAPAYIVAQLAGALLAAGVLAVIAKDVAPAGAGLGQFAANAWGAPQGNTLGAAGAFLVEAVTTFGFLMVIIGVTSRHAPAGFAPLAIGLCLALIHLITIPLTNTSVNPARSTSQAVFAGGAYLSQLWLFWVAPLVGGAAAGIAARWLNAEPNTGAGRA
jgi:aquaporin Z